MKAHDSASLTLMLLVTCCCLHGQELSQALSSDSGQNVIRGFDDRLQNYLNLRGRAEATLVPLLPNASAAEILRHERGLAHQIVRTRRHARQGDIFTLEITTEFLHLIQEAYAAPEAHIRTSIARGEPVRRRVHVNRPYPEGDPLGTSPPSLLSKLPELPEDLEYRIAARDLVIRDARSNLIVDFIRDAIPAI